MKRVFSLITMATAASAVQLRGDGIEEVGEQIEHFPPADYDGVLDRRSLMTESIDEKESFPEDGHMEIFTASIFGDDIDQNDRRDKECNANQQLCKIDIKTDLYGWETSWRLIQGNKVITKGPPVGQNYGRSQRYMGGMCLDQGQYRLQAFDKMGDGMSGQYGDGYVKVFCDNVFKKGIVDDTSNWKQKQLQFQVTGSNTQVTQGRSDTFGPDVGTPGTDWCDRVNQNTDWRKKATTCTTLSGVPGHRVRLRIRVDKFGMETSGKIWGPDTLFISKTIPNNGQQTKEKCMPPGQYKLTMTDFDGICCKHGEGKYEIFVDGKLLIKGGSFITSINHSFSLGHNWVEGMTPRDCEWWYGHDIRRRDWHTRCNNQYCDMEYRGLKWSASLKADAQDYANRLLATCDTTGINHDATDQGENLAKNKGSGAWGERYPADNLMKRFVDNEEFWGWNKNAHLTQAMWYSSQYIGCGESVKDMDGAGKMCRFQVCRYARAGNCMMASYDSDNGDNWRVPMMMDESPCGPMCPPGNVGCHH